jgi:hypothetical protein
MPEQEVDAGELEFNLSAGDMINALLPTLLANTTFLTKLANNPTFVTALCGNPLFQKCVNSLAGTVAGGVITQGLGR